MKIKSKTAAGSRRLLFFFLCFVIFLFRIYIPDIILVCFAGKDILYCFKGSTHTVVDIIIPVLTVTSDTEQVGDGIQIFT